MSLATVPNAAKPQPQGDVEVSREFLERIVAAANTASDDSTRYAMSCILVQSIGPEKVRIASTDGHCLTYQDIDAPPISELIAGCGYKHGSENLPAMMIHREAVPRIKGLLKSMGKAMPGVSAKYEILSSDNVRISMFGFSFDMEQAKDHYPDYSAVIPKMPETLVSVRFNADLIEKVAAALRDGNKSAPLTFHFDASNPNTGGLSLDPVLIEGPFAGRHAVLMPMRR